MKLLLDTHIFLWSLLDPDHLNPRVAAVLEDEANELWLSPMVIWGGVDPCGQEACGPQA